MGSASSHGDHDQPVPIFLINLDEDTDRLATMDSRLKALGFSYTRFPAYRGTNLPPWLREQFLDGDGNPFSFMNAGQIGCYASHLGVCRAIVDQQIEGAVLVLEDDVLFEPEIVAVLDNLDKLPADWEIVRSSNPPKSAFVPVGRLTERTEVLRYWRIPMGATAYFINRKGAERILAKSARRMRPVDSDLRRFWETGLITYGLLPLPIRWVPNESSRERVGRDFRSVRGRKVKAHRPGLAALRERWRLFGPELSIRCAWRDIRASLANLFGVKRRYSPALRVVPRRAAADP